MGWTAPRTWTTAEIVTASHLNEQVRDNEVYLKGETDKLDDVSHSEPTRVSGTIYHNGSKIRLVTITVEADQDESGNLVVLCDADASPSDRIGNIHVDYATARREAVTFVVPPDWYYKATASANASIYEWHEWELH